MLGVLWNKQSWIVSNRTLAIILNISVNWRISFIFGDLIFFPKFCNIFLFESESIYDDNLLGMVLFSGRQQQFTYSFCIALCIGCILATDPEGSYIVLFSLFITTSNKILLIFSHINMKFHFHFALWFSGLLQGLSVSSFGL